MYVCICVYACVHPCTVHVCVLYVCAFVLMCTSCLLYVYVCVCLSVHPPVQYVQKVCLGVGILGSCIFVSILPGTECEV